MCINFSMTKKFLIIEARFYSDIADGLLSGAQNALTAEGFEFDVVSVSGALEIPAVIKMAESKYAGFVALGCVIRGETYHFDIVANESARAIMDLTMQGILIGNGVITTEDKQQAMARAGEMDKGGFAARAAIELLKLREKYGR